MEATTAAGPAPKAERTDRPAPVARSPRFAMEHEGKQTPNLRFPGHLLQKDAGEPDRFLGQIPPALVDARRVIPADPESGVDRFEHRVEPLRQLAFLRNFELDAPVRIFVWARTRRWPIAAGETRKAWAMRLHPNPERSGA